MDETTRRLLENAYQSHRVWYIETIAGHTIPIRFCSYCGCNQHAPHHDGCDVLLVAKLLAEHHTQ